MSEVQKPVEETPVAAPAVDAPAATETPATEAAPEAAAEAPKETPAESAEAAPATETAETPAEEAKEEAKKEEVTPATEGVLGYKAPGLVKGLRFSKRFFYFSDEAVEAKQLSVFHQNEKPAVANPTAAWATQTGKGLLFLTKRAEDKATPAGIFNLAEVADITKDGNTEVVFKVNGQKHTFQAASAGERDSWFVALEVKAAEAKAEKETIVASEGYKAELEKLTNPAAAEKKTESKEEPKEEAKKDEAAPAEEPKDKAAAKSRSQSRKRTSIFGTLLGKKEETEEKKEEKAEDKAEEAKPAETTETPAEAAPATEAPAESAAAVETTENKEEQKEEKKEEKEEKEEKKEEKAEKAKSKRTSLFGGFFQKVTSPSQEKSEKEATAPAETTVASTAPQLENPVEEAAVKPIEPESVTAPAEGEAAKETPAPEAPSTEATATAATKEKRRTSLFFGKKKGDSDNEAEGEAKAKGNKLGGLFRRSSKAVKLDNKEETPAADAEAKANKPEPISKDAPAEEAAAEASKPAETEAPAAEEAKPVDVAASTPVQAAA